MTDEEKNKGGRPRRAGRKLRKISISIRPATYECLNLIAAMRRTSISQAVEYVAAIAATDMAVDGAGLMALAERLAGFPDSGLGALGRVAALPQSVRNPVEDLIAEVLEQIGGIDGLSEAEACLLFDVADDLERVGESDAQHAAEVWRKVCGAYDAGEHQYAFEDVQGIVFTFDLHKLRVRIKQGLPTRL